MQINVPSVLGGPGASILECSPPSSRIAARTASSRILVVTLLLPLWAGCVSHERHQRIQDEVTTLAAEAAALEQQLEEVRLERDRIRSDWIALQDSDTTASLISTLRARTAALEGDAVSLKEQIAAATESAEVGGELVATLTKEVES